MALSKIVLDGSVLGGVKEAEYKEVTNAGEDLRPGCVASAAVKVELFGEQETAVEAGDALSYYQIDKDGNETLMGVFYAEPTIKTKNSYTITAHDAASKLSADFSAWLQAHQSDFPTTVYALVSAACSVAGVTLGSASWPLSTQTVNAFYATGLTCRDIVSYAAEIACRFVRCHADGNLYFDWYTASASTIAPSVGTNQYAYKQDGLSYANYATAAVARVAVHPSGEDDVAYIYPTTASGNTMHIKNNLLLTDANAAFFNAVAQQVYTEMSAVGSYRPFDVSLFPMENPFRAGDIVTVTDIQGVAFASPIMTLTVNASAAKLESTGNETLSEDTNTRKELTQLASDVVRINKLKVDWAEIDQAIINYLTANNVTAQNLTIVDANDKVLATFTADGIVMGEADQARARFDFNSLELISKDSERYFIAGDMRNRNGVADIVERFIAIDVYAQSFYLQFTPVENSVTVTVNGLEVEFTLRDGNVVGVNGLQGGETVTINYKTTSPVYRYDFGQRNTEEWVGAYSAVCGYNNAASDYASAVIGGKNSKAAAAYAVVIGGDNNVVAGYNSAIIAGNNNTVGGPESVIIGGQDNRVSGSKSAVVGSYRSQASGQESAVIGCENGVASGNRSVVLGGNGAVAAKLSQVVFGDYNVAETGSSYAKGQYIEIVGNGESSVARSNARTLDWQGNETLAGGLTLGTPLTPGNGGTGVTTLAGAANAMITGEAVSLEAVAGVTIVRQSCYRYGSMLVVNAFVTLANNISSNGNIVGLPSAFRFGVVQDIVGAATSGGSKIFYVPANTPYIRTNGAAAAGSYIINGLLHLTDY